MVVVMVCAVAALVAAAAVGVAAVVAGRRSWVKRVTAERVLVHTTDAQTVEGVLRDWSRDGLVLAAPRLVDQEADLAGEVFIARERVLMIQRHQVGG